MTTTSVCENRVVNISPEGRDDGLPRVVLSPFGVIVLYTNWKLNIPRMSFQFVYLVETRDRWSLLLRAIYVVVRCKVDFFVKHDYIFVPRESYK